jgi:hypothetical protein
MPRLFAKLELAHGDGSFANCDAAAASANDDTILIAA